MLLKIFGTSKLDEDCCKHKPLMYNVNKNYFLRFGFLQYGFKNKSPNFANNCQTFLHNFYITFQIYVQVILLVFKLK